MTQIDSTQLKLIIEIVKSPLGQVLCRNFTSSELCSHRVYNCAKRKRMTVALKSRANLASVQAVNPTLKINATCKIIEIF